MTITPASRIARRRHVRAGFTLIEILIVVVILGILASVVVVQVNGATSSAIENVFAANLRGFADAAERYRLEQGEYPDDGGSGECPAGFEQYVLETTFENPTPFGGVWDVERDESGISSAVGVHFDGGSDPGDAVMLQIDILIDNGDLTTGVFRKLAAGRYYWIVAE